MDFAIALWLSQDAVTNGAIYALLALALVIVYTVTRVILVPQGEFITYAALSLATLQAGRVPGTVYLLIIAGLAVIVLDAPAWPGAKPGAALWRRSAGMRFCRCWLLAARGCRRLDLMIWPLGCSSLWRS